jgi:hypothetical protein
MRRMLLAATLLIGALPTPADAAAVLPYAGTGVHYCESGLFGTTCTIDATSSTMCGSTTGDAPVACTVTLDAVYGIPRTNPPSTNPLCSASGTGTVRITDELGTPYPLVVVSFGGTGGAFEFDGVAGTAPALTAVYGRFTITALCGKQSGRFAGVVVRS